MLVVDNIFLVVDTRAESNCKVEYWLEALECTCFKLTKSIYNKGKLRRQRSKGLINIVGEAAKNRPLCDRLYIITGKWRRYDI